MAPTSDEGVLFPAPAGPAQGAVVINARCRIQEREGYRVVSVSGLPLAHFAAGDREGEAYAMVSLVDLGRARQGEVARAFGCDVRTVRRHQRRFEEGGLAVLGRPPGFPRGQSRVSPSRREAVDRWKAEGVSNREIARRLGIDEKAVRKLVGRLGWSEPPAEQATLPFEGADPKLSASPDPSGAPARPAGAEAPEVSGAPADPNLSARAAEPEPEPGRWPPGRASPAGPRHRAPRCWCRRAVLRATHHTRDPAADGALTGQAPRGARGTLAAPARPGARARPRPGGQDPAPGPLGPGGRLPMFERWGQENFFKYLREEFALDALVDDATEPADAERHVPNPERKKLDAELRQARIHFEQLQAHYGLAALENRERRRPTMRGFKIASAELSARVRQAMQRISELERKRTTVPARVPVQEVVAADVVKLAVERKHLTDLLEMVAYQAEGDLVRLLAPHYRRTEQEGRTLIQSALAAGGDLELTATEITVALDPSSSPHKTQALAAVCHALNATATRFPGTGLRMRFALKPEPARSLAFPGPRDPSGGAQPDFLEWR